MSVATLASKSSSARAKIQFGRSSGGGTGKPSTERRRTGMMRVLNSAPRVPARRLTSAQPQRAQAKGNPCQTRRQASARTRSDSRSAARRLADRDVGAGADALRVRDQGGAAVVLVFESARHAAREQ